jgi:TRAP-type uncharacterized transport system fused permease subunit
VTNLTGLANYFQQFVIYLSGGHLFLLIILLLIAGLFIGMGLPTTPSYVVLVILGVPALIKMGVPTLTAHLVVFWISVQSAVTPPVALLPGRCHHRKIKSIEKDGLRQRSPLGFISCLPVRLYPS